MGALTKTKAKQVEGLGDLALLDEITASLIADATANGRSLLTAANYAAMRTLLGLGALALLSEIAAADISDASASGQSLIKAADYAAMRTLLGLADIASSGSASDLDTGTVPAARLNIGTAANQLVALNGSAKLPAVDGSLLTNLPSSAPTTSQVEAATAGIAYGDVGTYAFLTLNTASSAIIAGSTYAGTALRDGGVTGTAGVQAGAALSGTWRALGATAAVSSQKGATVFVRIS